jgi:hypothetical protein
VSTSDELIHVVSEVIADTNLDRENEHQRNELKKQNHEMSLTPNEETKNTVKELMGTKPLEDDQTTLPDEKKLAGGKTAEDLSVSEDNIVDKATGNNDIFSIVCGPQKGIYIV